MSDDNETDQGSHDDQPDFNTAVHTDEEVLTKSRGGISRAFAILLFMLASLLGGAIGWAGPKIFSTPDKTLGIQAQMQSTLSGLEAKSKANRDQLAKLQKTMGSNQDGAQGRADSLSELTTQIDGLNEQVKTLTGAAKAQADNLSAATADKKLFTDLKDRLATLEGLSAKDGDLSQGAQAMLDRFSAIEDAQEQTSETLSNFEEVKTELEDLRLKYQDKPSFPAPITEPINIPPVISSTDRLNALITLMDTFPREKMLEAVAAQEAIAAEKPSWLQRTLSKHVKVRDNDEIGPRTLIKDAEKLLEGGHVNDALTLLGKLNPPVRAVASDWMGAAKKAAKAIEEGQ